MNLRLKVFVALVLALLASGCAYHDHDYLVYVGTYTSGESDGIYVYRFNSVSGELIPIGLAAKAVNPSYFVVDAAGEFLYSVNEIDTFRNEASGAISTYAIDRVSGALQLRQQVSSTGAAPCYVSLDHTGRNLFVANYGGGNVAAFRLNEDGQLHPHHQVIQGGPGSGAHPLRQGQAHAHYIHVTPDNRYVLVADLGQDLVAGYKLEGGFLQSRTVLSMEPGSGPRHLTYSPAGNHLYVLNELSSKVALVSWNGETGVMQLLQSISTLPADFTAANTGAAIASVNGRHLYVSNRGHNSIGRFQIDPDDGHLTSPEWFSSGGQIPRHFEIDPTGRWMIVANQESGNLTLFSIDLQNGRLKPHGEPQKLSMPVCVRFVPVH